MEPAAWNRRPFGDMQSNRRLVQLSKIDKRDHGFLFRDVNIKSNRAPTYAITGLTSVEATAIRRALEFYCKAVSDSDIVKGVLKKIGDEE